MLTVWLLLFSVTFWAATLKSYLYLFAAFAFFRISDHLRGKPVKEIRLPLLILSILPGALALLWVPGALVNYTGGGVLLIAGFSLFFLVTGFIKIPVLFYAASRVKTDNILFLCSVTAIALFLDLLPMQVLPWKWGNFTAADPFVRQHAGWMGASGLTVVFFLQGYLINRAVDFFQRRKFVYDPDIIYSLVVMALLGGSGLWKYWRQEDVSGRRVRVASIQPNLNQKHETDEAAFAAKSLSKNAAMIHQVIVRGAPDLIVLPESAIPFHSTDPADGEGIYSVTYDAVIRTVLAEGGSDIFYNQVRKAQDGRSLLNTASIRHADTGETGYYFKRNLFPIGEYVPFEFLRKHLPRTPRFQAGGSGENLSFRLYEKPERKPPTRDEFLAHIQRLEKKAEPVRSKLKTVSEVVFRPLICYEALYSSAISEGDQGYAFLINISNDSWLDSRLAMMQHNFLASIRGVEAGRPLIRTTLNGISAYYDSRGTKIANLGGPYRENISFISVPVEQKPSLFARLGFWGFLPSWIFLLLLSVSGYFLTLNRKAVRN